MDRQMGNRPNVARANYSRFWDDRIKETRRSYPGISELLIKGLERYVKDRIPTGSFLRAVLDNDLTSAVAHADDENMPNLRYIVMFTRVMVPAIAMGSHDQVNKWIIGVE